MFPVHFVFSSNFPPPSTSFWVPPSSPPGASRRSLGLFTSLHLPGAALDVTLVDFTKVMRRQRTWQQVRQRGWRLVGEVRGESWEVKLKTPREVIQAVTFSPNVGSHLDSPFKGARFHHPQKLTKNCQATVVSGFWEGMTKCTVFFMGFISWTIISIPKRTSTYPSRIMVRWNMGASK